MTYQSPCKLFQFGSICKGFCYPLKFNQLAGLWLSLFNSPQELLLRDLVAKQTKELQARIAAEQAQSAMLIRSLAGLFDEFENWIQARKLQRKMLHCEQLKTGETKKAEIYEDDEYELY